LYCRRVGIIGCRKLTFEYEVSRARDAHGSDEECVTIVAKPEGKRPLVRSRRRCEDNIKMYLREMGYEGFDWKMLLRIDTGGELL
jgi:hypothetical protein